jgi:hypothetical protein
MLRAVQTTSLAQVIGANCKRIRSEHGVSQSQLATHARRLGLRWTASKVGDFEAGRFESPFATVLTAVLAIDNAIGSAPGPLRVLRSDGWHQVRKRPRVTLADLLQTGGFVRLTPEFEPIGTAVAAVCSGKPWELATGDERTTAERADELLAPAPGILGERYRMRLRDVEDMRKRSDVNEARVCKRLDIDPDTLLGLSYALWDGRTFTEERDRRAVANPNRRGIVSRELHAELRKALTDGNR